MVQITIFWTQKMVLDLVFYCFLCISMVYIIQNPNYPIFLGYLEILRENRPIFAKNGSRSLKSRYLKNTFSLITWERNMLESWNLAKLWAKMIEKTCTIQFWAHFEKNGLCMLPNRFKGSKIGKKNDVRMPNSFVH